MNRNLNPNEFGFLDEMEEAGLYLQEDSETRSSFLRQVAFPDRSPAPQGSARRYTTYDDDYQSFAPETVSDSGKAYAAYASGSGHPSIRN
jgi:hypothetical protein